MTVVSLLERSRDEKGQLVDLTDRDRRRALLVSVLIPYLKAKLDGLYARWQADRASGGSGTSLLLESADTNEYLCYFTEIATRHLIL